MSDVGDLLDEINALLRLARADESVIFECWNDHWPAFVRDGTLVCACDWEAGCRYLPAMLAQRDARAALPESVRAQLAEEQR